MVQRAVKRCERQGYTGIGCNVKNKTKVAGSLQTQMKLRTKQPCSAFAESELNTARVPLARANDALPTPRDKSLECLIARGADVIGTHSRGNLAKTASSFYKSS